jgi:DNA-binding GntR family transcriptional regulator
MRLQTVHRFCMQNDQSFTAPWLRSLTSRAARCTTRWPARLRTLLVEGRIAPGAKLNERVLAKQLHVSRTPLREAIKLLAAEGLVDLLPNRGAVAVKLTETDVVHSFEVLAGLEGHVGRAGGRTRITDAELAEIRALHYEMLAAFARRDLSGYYRLNARIHAAINAAAANPVLAATYAASTRACRRCAFAPTRTSAKWRAPCRSTPRWCRRWPRATAPRWGAC